ncbi:MAG: FAD:protein FMN transferase, partial [Chloroflexia bacterium]
MQKLEFRAMGSGMAAIVDTDSPAAGERLARIPSMFEEWEDALSRFRPDSELSKLNRQSDSTVEVTPVLWHVLCEALGAANLTDGLVTPTMLTALENSGYRESFDILKGVSSVALLPQKAAGLVKQDDWRGIKLDGSKHTVTTTPGMRLDLGGIAKGWAAGKAAHWLGEIAPAMVDAGGDIAFSGSMADGTAWPIGVADPLMRDEQLDLLALRGGGVATSGRDYRRWRVGEKWQHHILDPRTGEPAETDVLSATVVAPSAIQAEVAAKVALILGSQKGME